MTKTKTKIKKKFKQNFGKILIIGNIALVGVVANLNLMAMEWSIPIDSPIMDNQEKTRESKQNEPKTLVWPEEDKIKQEVLGMIYDAGISPEEADKIIECESRWQPDAHAINWNGKQGVDRGLWQISSLYHPEVSNADAYNYIKATEHAIRIYKERGNWSAWACDKIIVKK